MNLLLSITNKQISPTSNMTEILQTGNKIGRERKANLDS